MNKSTKNPKQIEKKTSLAPIQNGGIFVFLWRMS